MWLICVGPCWRHVYFKVSCLPPSPSPHKQRCSQSGGNLPPDLWHRTSDHKYKDKFVKGTPSNNHDVNRAQLISPQTADPLRAGMSLYCLFIVTFDPSLSTQYIREVLPWTITQKWYRTDLRQFSKILNSIIRLIMLLKIGKRFSVYIIGWNARWCGRVCLRHQ